jgi:chromosome segregation ATPase
MDDMLDGLKQTESSHVRSASQSELNSLSTFEVSNQLQKCGNSESPSRVDRNNVVFFTPPFSSPLSLQTDSSVKRKAREAALQLQALHDEKAHLQGKLQAVHAEYSRVLEEKVILQQALATTQAELGIAKQRNESLAVKQTELQQAFNLMNDEGKATRSRHQRVTDISGTRLSEVEKQMGTLREENNKLRLQYEQHTAELVTKQQAVDELERKVEDLDQLAAVYQSDRVELSNKLVFHQKKGDSLETMREFLEQQIEGLRLQQKTVQEENTRIKSELVLCREQLDQSQCDQLELELRLSSLQDLRVIEKRRMVEMLEQISKDWSDHENVFEKARIEKKDVDEALRNAQKTAMEE